MSALDDLLDVLDLAPPLAGAGCSGRSELFDDAEEHVDYHDAAYAERAALRICSTCPVLTRCSECFDSLPLSHRPLGVIAGRINRKRSIGQPRRISMDYDDVDDVPPLRPLCTQCVRELPDRDDGLCAFCRVVGS
ncbi:hypothetical protein [Mycolicibacterium frederiksbergense]|uniref:hypothetical protein n=1 Tax=Mycolicibacterium frederiksbergense TaxID=117567 RepID=UPI00265C4F11|nr:hypothetical protein [Mycolicibacterium frederiksbergense]MDO0975987.1 hypothetical protein [Mycolicibacterium frederiksbergense]